MHQVCTDFQYRLSNPSLLTGKAIQLHPLCSERFHADYDGDQMAVHLPLSDAAQAEAGELMSAGKNLLKPADGAPVLAIYQDVVLGIYYLTYDKPGTETKEVKPFSSVYEAEMAYDQGLIALQTPIRVFAKGDIRNTTLGRVIFNEILPKDYPYDDSVQTSKQLKKVMADIFDMYGAEITVKTADAVKNLAFEYETIASVSTAKMTTQLIQKSMTSLPKVMLKNRFDPGTIRSRLSYRRRTL